MDDLRLKKRLRGRRGGVEYRGNPDRDCQEAANLIDRQAAEIAALRAALKNLVKAADDTWPNGIEMALAVQSQIPAARVILASTPSSARIEAAQRWRRGERDAIIIDALDALAAKKEPKA